jgi:hypothetical protein
MTDDERHLFWRAQARRNKQIALVLAVVVIGHDDEFATRKGSDGGLDTLMCVVHRSVIPARRRNAVVPDASTLGLFLGGHDSSKAGRSLCARQRGGADNGQAGGPPTWPRWRK